MAASAMAPSKRRRLSCASMSPTPPQSMRLLLLARREALASESHRNELIVVDRLRLRHDGQDSEFPQRMPDHVDRRRIPGTVGRETRNLRVINFRGDAGLDLDGLGFGRHHELLVCSHERDRLEPTAQEPPQQVRPFFDEIVGRKDDVGVGVLRYLAEQEEVFRLAGFLQLVAGRRLDHHAVKFTALNGRKPRLHLAEREDLHAVAAPALLSRQFPHEPVRERAHGGHPDALAIEIRDGPNRAAEREHEREIGGRPIHGGNPDRWRPLGAETEPGARTQADVQAARRERLLELSITAKARDLDLNSFRRKDFRLDSHLGRAERKGVGNRLAESHLLERQCLPAGPRRNSYEQGYQHAAPDKHSLSLFFVGNGRPPRIGMAQTGTVFLCRGRSYASASFTRPRDIGRLRIRLPVSWNSALAMAGATAITPISPMPVGGLSVVTIFV